MASDQQEDCAMPSTAGTVVLTAEEEEARLAAEFSTVQEEIDRERQTREEAERAAEEEREDRRRRREREEAERKEQAAERRRAAAERKKREKAERAAEEERLQRENAALSQEVMQAVLKAKQREREEEVLVHWHGRCVALDYEPQEHENTILNTTCPVCLSDFERGERIWRLHCSHAGCDECFSSLMRLVGQGGTATRDFGCPLCRTLVLPAAPDGASAGSSSSASPAVASSAAAPSATSPPSGTAAAAASGSSGSASTRVFVRFLVDRSTLEDNPPFRTRTEARDLFAQFGRVTDLFFPKGMEAGFFFVDYETPASAQAALSRPLVTPRGIGLKLVIATERPPLGTTAAGSTAATGAGGSGGRVAPEASTATRAGDDAGAGGSSRTSEAPAPAPSAPAASSASPTRAMEATCASHTLAPDGVTALLNIPPPEGVSLAVHIASHLGAPKREVVNAIFATGVPVFAAAPADVRCVLAHLGLCAPATATIA